MTDLAELALPALFVTVVVTFIIAPIYFFLARKIAGRTRLIAITSVVAIALTGCAVAAHYSGGPGVSDSVGFRSGMAFLICALLAVGWFTSALFYWLYTILARP